MEKLESLLRIITGMLKIILLVVLICFFAAISCNIPVIISGAERITEKISITVKNVKVEDVGVTDVKVEQVNVEDVHVGRHLSLESDKRQQEMKEKKEKEERK